MFCSLQPSCLLNFHLSPYPFKTLARRQFRFVACCGALVVALWVPWNPAAACRVSYAVADLNGDGILDLFIKDYVAGPKSVPAALSRILKGSPDWSVTTPEIAHPSTNLLKANR